MNRRTNTNYEILTCKEGTGINSYRIDKDEDSSFIRYNPYTRTLTITDPNIHNGKEVATICLCNQALIAKINDIVNQYHPEETVYDLMQGEFSQIEEQNHLDTFSGVIDGVSIVAN